MTLDNITRTSKDPQSSPKEGSSSDNIRHEMNNMIEKILEMNSVIQTRNSTEIQEEMITIYGDVELSSQERSFLALGPGFPLMEKLDSSQMERDFLTALTKIR